MLTGEQVGGQKGLNFLVCVCEQHSDKLSNTIVLHDKGDAVFKQMQSGFETLVTYLKLNIQVLVQRLTAFLLLQSQSCGSEQIFISQ